MATLIAEEGSITVADYMNQHFADRRLQQRCFLSEHLRQLDAELSVTPRSLPVVSSVPESAPPVDFSSSRHPRLKVLLGVSVVAAAVALAIFGIPGSGSGTGGPLGIVTVEPRPPSVTPSSSGSPTAPRPPIADAAIAVRATPSPDRATISASSSRRRGADAASRREVARRAAARRARMPAADPTPDDRNHLTVPLFTRWQ